MPSRSTGLLPAGVLTLFAQARKTKNRERTVLARIQPQLLFIPSYSSRTLLWTPLSVPPASALRERKQPNGGGVLRVERRVEMVRSTRKAKAQCLPRRRLCTVQPRAAREATARVRCFLGVGAAAGARGARRGGGDGRGRGAVVPCWVQGDLLHPFCEVYTHPGLHSVQPRQTVTCCSAALCSYCSASAPATWPASADCSSLARARDEAGDVDVA